MNLKKLGKFINETCTVHKLLLLKKKQKTGPMPATKILKEHLFMKIFKKFSEYICRPLQYHQHRITSKTGISLRIILNNVFNALIILNVL